MKKVLIFVLCCLAVVFCFKSYQGSGGKNIGAKGDSLLSYLPGDPQLIGNKLYIKGMFSNGSREYDILNLSDVKVVVTDKSGNEQARITLNSQFAKNCVIGPYGTVPYNFSCDASNFTVQSVWDLRFDVVGEYYYVVIPFSKPFKSPKNGTVYSVK